MKILHTSDWHIGQKLYGFDRTDEHRLFFDWLIQNIQDLKIDAVLVCGDIFDVGYPSNLALKTYYHFLKNMIGTNCRKLIITGGNHDYVATLEAPREVLELINVHVVGGVPEKPEDQIVELMDEKGDIRALVGAVPFLRDKDIRTSVAGESAQDRIEATRKGIISYYEKLADLSPVHRKPKLPFIVTGHLYMQGSEISDSERDIHLGNQAGVSASAIPSNFDYFALGHIHRAQTISENPPVVYSGSPLPLSFSEQHNKKSVRIIEINDGIVTHQKLAVPQFRKLKSFEGSYNEVSENIKLYKTTSVLPDWLEMKIVEQEYDPLLSRVADQFVEDFNTQNPEIQIIRHSLTFANRNRTEYLMEETGKALNDLKETEVFDNLLDREGIEQREELIHSFNQLLEIVHTSQTK